VRCWHGYLSGARRRLAYSPADAIAIHCLLLQQNPDWFYFSGAADLDGPGKRASKRVFVVDEHVDFQIKLSDTLLQLLN